MGPQRVTTSLASLRTPMAHAVTRTRTQPRRAQPTLWGMLNAQQQQSLPAMLILSKWALACCLLGWVPLHELQLNSHGLALLKYRAAPLCGMRSFALHSCFPFPCFFGLLTDSLLKDR